MWVFGKNRENIFGTRALIKWTPQLKMVWSYPLQKLTDNEDRWRDHVYINSMWMIPGNDPTTHQRHQLNFIRSLLDQTTSCSPQMNTLPGIS